MKKLFVSLILTLSLVLFHSKSNAWMMYAGYAHIKWNGNPWTATSGSVSCYGPITVICCAISGSTIAINMSGSWWYGTITNLVQGAEQGEIASFSRDGLSEGEPPY